MASLRSLSCDAACSNSVCSSVHVQPLAVPVVSMPSNAADVTWRARAAGSESVSHSPMRAASLAMNSLTMVWQSTRAGRGSLPGVNGELVLDHGAQYPESPVW